MVGQRHSRWRQTRTLALLATGRAGINCTIYSWNELVHNFLLRRIAINGAYDGYGKLAESLAYDAPLQVRSISEHRLGDDRNTMQV